MIVSAMILMIGIQSFLSTIPKTGKPESGDDFLGSMTTLYGMFGALTVIVLTIFFEDVVFRTWIRRGRFVVPISVVSSLLFALVHAFNYDRLSPLLYPIMLSPQFVCGLIMCFVRVELGFWWSFLLHLFYDFTLFAVGGLQMLGKAKGFEPGVPIGLYAFVVLALAMSILFGVFRQRGVSKV